jgi:hypothetical protein
MDEFRANLEPAETEPCPSHRTPHGPEHPAYRADAALPNNNRCHRLLDDHGLPHDGDALLDHNGPRPGEAAAEPPGLSGRSGG